MDVSNRLPPVVVSIPSKPSSLTYEFFSNAKDYAKEELSLEIHHSGSLFKQGAEIGALSKGVLDMATVSPEDIAASLPQNKACQTLTRSYKFISWNHLNSYYDGFQGQQLLQEVEIALDIVIIGRIYRGVRHLIFPGNINVQTPADLREVALRIPEAAPWHKLAESLGARPQGAPIGKLKELLQRKQVDGHENTISTIEAYDLTDVTKTIVLSAHKVDILFVVVSRKKWKELSDKQQKALSAAVKRAREEHDNKLLQNEEIELRRLVDQGIVLRSPDIDAFKRYARSYYGI